MIKRTYTYKILCDKCGFEDYVSTDLSTTKDVLGSLNSFWQFKRWQVWSITYKEQEIPTSIYCPYCREDK